MKARRAAGAGRRRLAQLPLLDTLALELDGGGLDSDDDAELRRSVTQMTLESSSGVYAQRRSRW